MVTQIPESRKGLSGVEFRHFGVFHFGNSNDKEPRPFALKVPKSQNTACLWSGILAFRLSGAREVEEAVTFESRVSNSRFVKSRRGKEEIPEKLRDDSHWAPIGFRDSRGRVA